MRKSSYLRSSETAKQSITQEPKGLFHRINLKWLLGPGGLLAALENRQAYYLTSVFLILANSILANRIFKTVSSPTLEKSYYLPNQFKNTLNSIYLKTPHKSKGDDKSF